MSRYTVMFETRIVAATSATVSRRSPASHTLRVFFGIRPPAYTDRSDRYRSTSDSRIR
ncbi:MAG: hypothetical protein KatS3mg014_1269 [Actinomycetota bacterium]|nr:MAG: hypothetical protein KatS3mg014_1269 [Actinomycetota bacterium]